MNKDKANVKAQIRLECAAAAQFMRSLARCGGL